MKFIILSLAVLGAVHCGGTEATPQGLEAETCPAEADSCPPECIQADAYLLDVERKCRQKRVLGCQGPATGVDDDFPCAKRISDGTLWFGPSAVFDTTRFEICSEAESEQAVGAAVGCDE